jgi:NitT/TauT family transport system substrate-binding protein
MNVVKPLIAAVLCLLLGGSGCNRDGSKSSGGLTKVRVGIVGITCEAPLYSAYEKGFFKEEGLDVEFVRCDWASYKDALALGRYDITHHLVMMFLKPVEQGLDVKFTGGVHRGCLRVQAGIKTNITRIEDLRGKRIGVPGMGTPPFIFANRVLGARGIDPQKDIDWRVYPNGELGLALDKGEVDAVANSEPIGSILLAQGKVRNLADQAKDAPYKDEYCCAVICNGKWLAKNPQTAAAATRAILKGAKWVQANPMAAAKLSVEKKYIASTVELNAGALGNLSYVPSVIGAREAVDTAGAEMKTAGMLNPGTDLGALSKRAFIQLEGVSDEWLNNVKVETVAGGQLPPDWDFMKIAANSALDQAPPCCAPKFPELFQDNTRYAAAEPVDLSVTGRTRRDR